MEKILPVSQLNLTRYTWEAWKKCYPDSNKDEWDYMTLPNNVIDLLCRVIDENDLPEDIDYRLCIIDEEYFNWLGNKENTGEKRLEYINNLSDEDTNRLLKKNNLDIEDTFIYLPFILINKDGFNNFSFQIPWTIKNSINNYLKDKFNAEMLFIGDYLISTDTIYNCFDEIADKLYDYESIKDYRKTVIQEPVNLVYACLPIIVRKRLDTAKFNIDNIFLEFDYSSVNIEDISVSEFKINNSIDVKTCLYIGDPFFAIEEENEFKESLNQEIKANKNGYNKYYTKLKYKFR